MGIFQYLPASFFEDSDSPLNKQPKGYCPEKKFGKWKMAIVRSNKVYMYSAI